MPEQRLRLRLHAANLPKVRVDRFRRVWPDTHAVVTSISASADERSGTQWGQTEVVEHSSHPQWTRCIEIDYDASHTFLFYVHLFAGQQSLGAALFDIGDLLSTAHQTRVKRLREGGCVFCRVERVEEKQRTLQWHVRAADLVRPQARRRFLGRPSTQWRLEMARLPNQGSHRTWMTIYRSTAESKAEWDARIEMGPVSETEPLCLSVIELRRRAGDRLVGLAETTLQRLLELGVAAKELTNVEEQAPTVAMVVEGEPLAADRPVPVSTTNNFVDEGPEDYGQEPRGSVTSPDDTDEEDHSSESSSSRNNDRLGENELFLQRSATKLKRVGRLCILRAAIVDEKDEADPALPRSNTSQEIFTEVVDLSALQPLPAPRSGLSFAEYRRRGGRLHFCVAIDFTSSNGDPRLPSSLHHQSLDSLNDYEETILAIGKTMDAYAGSDKEQAIRGGQYSVWGFGAKFGGQVRHLFQLGDVVQGVDGILSAYRSVFRSGLIMSGPTILTQVLQAAAVQARKHEQTTTVPPYTVLLIITDGQADEFEETQRKLAVYSALPLSVVIVGVGRQADFGRMYQLCQPSSPSTRRNVTFVVFRRHQHDPSALGNAALGRIPQHIAEYTARRGLA